MQTFGIFGQSTYCLRRTLACCKLELADGAWRIAFVFEVIRVDCED